MGTEVLRPQQDVFDIFHTQPFHRRKYFPANENFTYLIVNRKPNYGYTNKISPKNDRKKSPAAKKSRDASQPKRNDDVTNGGGPVNGSVTLLRRGASLDSFTSKIRSGNPKTKARPVDDLAVCQTGRIGSESPEMVPKQIRVLPPSVYAGSACATSPSPRSVPLPLFFSKKQQSNQRFDDSASKDLRRMLNLQ